MTRTKTPKILSNTPPPPSTSTHSTPQPTKSVKSSSITQEFIHKELSLMQSCITALMLEQKNEIIAQFQNENRGLKLEILELKEKIEEKTGQVNELEKDMVNLQQYIRRNNIEICGIPDNVNIDVLEDCVIDIAKTIDVSIEKFEIEACHRIESGNKARRGPKNTIVGFTNRKTCNKLYDNKKKLMDIKTKKS